MPLPENTAVRIADDDVSLTFKAEDGREATINIGKLAEQLGGETRTVLLAWCEDRRKESHASGGQKRPLLAQDFED